MLRVPRPWPRVREKRCLYMARSLEVLTIIHNKMDNAKQAHNVLLIESRPINGVFKLLVSILSNMVLSNVFK